MTPRTKKARIDKFSRFLVIREQANRRRGKPGFDLAKETHGCGTPACVGGYLETYPPYKRNPIGWGTYTDLSWSKHFDGFAESRTALQAANLMREEVGLTPFKSTAAARSRS